jgi:hypothetical protein
MKLVECEELKLMLSQKAWDLASNDYGYADIKKGTNIAKLAAQFEVDAAEFAGCDQYQIETGQTRHDGDDNIIYWVKFFKDNEEYIRVERHYDSRGNCQVDYLANILENQSEIEKKPFVI